MNSDHFGHGTEMIGELPFWSRMIAVLAPQVLAPQDKINKKY